jgi:hypothetical protein
MGASNDSTQPRSSFKDARVRDRRASWFSEDNEVLDDFGPLIGLHGFAVYCALSRYAYAGDEEANMSLTKLCTHLKMGRAKLLETLGELRDVGLIAIERGDRKTTNTYTLLEVPKGGSEQNKVVPSRTLTKLERTKLLKKHFQQKKKTAHASRSPSDE